YTYSVFSHATNFQATSVGEARFCAKLNDELFDWMTVDANRNLKMLTAYDWNHGTVMNMKEARRLNSGLYRGRVEHKYDYAANQFEVRAWGWTSTAKRVGVWFINPAVEYLSGGPTKYELCAHRDATFGTNLTGPAPPTLLNYWRSSHYGGSVCAVGEGEVWAKVIGPFVIYCNSGDSGDGLWTNALAKASVESGKWPYEWVRGVDYPHKAERGTVNGRLVLRDTESSRLGWSRLLVGLTAPESGAGAGRPVEWQRDAKGYQFWVRGDSEGKFTISNIRPGTYSLRGIAEGVLGEFTLPNLTVGAGQTLELGTLEWRPIRYGKQVWEIGIPNRSGSEFFKGDDYFHWGWYLEYPKLFPTDVNFVIGKSDFRKDWFFEQVPHNEDAANTNAAGRGRGTTWSVAFGLPVAPRGKATLRLAICGVGTRSLAGELNGQPIGNVTGLVYNATVIRDGISGTWSEHDLAFDASLMRAGENVLKLTIPGGGLANGIIYDYLRLELDESSRGP
ncbi:MAG TPA: polysaccharide lyase family protein, partial [Verrucomicrobiae bacterium]